MNPLQPNILPVPFTIRMPWTFYAWWIGLPSLLLPIMFSNFSRLTGTDILSRMAVIYSVPIIMMFFIGARRVNFELDRVLFVGRLLRTTALTYNAIQSINVIRNNNGRYLLQINKATSDKPFLFVIDFFAKKDWPVILRTLSIRASHATLNDLAIQIRDKTP